MSVFRSLLSLCSVTFICCLIISADVNGRLGLEAGNVEKAMLPLKLWLWWWWLTGDDGVDPPPVPTQLTDDILRDGDLFNIFNPNARFTRLFGVIVTTPLARALGEPGLTDPDPLTPSPLPT